MAVYECCFLDGAGNLAGPPRPMDGLTIESVYDRALETLFGEPGYIGFELLQDQQSLRRFIRRAREIE